jgi:hypothetical protein
MPRGDFNRGVDFILELAATCERKAAQRAPEPSLGRNVGPE